MRCLICHKELIEGEDTVCLECLSRFPLVESAVEENPLFKTFCGQVSFEHATTLAYYQPGDHFSKIIRRAKFGNWPQGNAYLAHLLVEQLQESSWPYDIDLIMPVPVHWLRFLMRGYNQVTPIVRTLSQEWHIPLETGCLRRSHYVRSQLRSSADERKKNQQSAFRINHPERLAGKHILLVDDVCTSGATLLACSDLLLQIPGVRVSFLTLALTFRM